MASGGIHLDSACGIPCRQPVPAPGADPQPRSQTSACRGAARAWDREQPVLSAVSFSSAFLFVFPEWSCWIVTSRRRRGGSRCFAAALMWVFSTSSNSLPSQRSELHPLLITAALQRRRRGKDPIQSRCFQTMQRGRGLLCL